MPRITPIIKNSNIQTYLYGEDGTGNTSGKIKELREQLSLIENTDPSKTVKDFDKNCKTLDGTLDSTSQYLKELGFDFRDIKQANVDMTKFKSVYERATKLENLISNKGKYSFLIDSINGIKSAASSCEGDVTELSARLSSLEVEANRCGATTETLSQKLSRLFKEHFQTAVAMYGVAMVKQGLREVYNNVVDIDTSMTNLKKSRMRLNRHTQSFCRLLQVKRVSLVLLSLMLLTVQQNGLVQAIHWTNHKSLQSGPLS